MRSLRTWLAATGLLAVLACNTPSVPLPPPDLPTLSFSSAGMGLVTLSGAPTPAHANVRFYVYNTSRGDGVITTAGANGAFTTSPFAGTEGDNADLYYDTGPGERSQDACVQIHLNGPLISIPCR